MKTVIPLWDDPELETVFSPQDYQLRRDLVNLSTREFRQAVRQIEGSQLILWCYDSKALRNSALLQGLALFSAAKEKWLWDKEGRKQKITLTGWLREDCLRQGIAALLIPLWLLYFKLTLPLLEQALKGKKPVMGKTKTVGFLHTDHRFETGTGGPLERLSGLIRGFTENRYAIEVFSSHRPAGFPEDKFSFHLMRPDEGFASFQEIPELIYNLKLDRQIGEILKTTPPDFLYQRYSLNNFSGLLLALQLKIPLVLEYPGSFTGKEKQPKGGLRYPGFSAKIEELNLRYADLIVVVSPAMKDELTARGFDPEGILVNPDGADPEQNGEIPQAGKTSLLVEPGNIEQPAEKIVPAQNPQILEQPGHAAREKYTWRENAEKVLSALKEKFNQ